MHTCCFQTERWKMLSALDNQLNIIQVADLVLPDKDTTFEEYTTIELLSVSMLIVISTFALRFYPFSDRCYLQNRRPWMKRGRS
ncbi:ATP-binding protein [Clostridioides difficile]